jgi:cell division protein FtsI/penicillin-binding protein 2
MPMKKLRIACALMIIPVIIFSIGGCQESLAPEDTVSQFLSRYERMDFPRMYSLLSARSKREISLNEFCDRYESLFDAMKVTSVVCTAAEPTAQSETGRTIPFTMAVESERLGSFTLEMTLPLELQKRRWGVDWSPSLILPDMKDGDEIRLYPIAASRGEIFDASGNLLAANDHAPTVYVDLDLVDDPEALVRMLAPMLLISESTLRTKMTALFEEEPTQTGEESASAPSRVRLVVLKAYTEAEMTPEFEESLLTLPGVGIERNSFTPIRSYPYGQLLAHLLGYTGPVTAEDLDANPGMTIPSDGLIGKAGLEKSYNDVLTGTPGWELVVLSEEGERRQIVRRAAQNGQDLRLSIDIELQRQAELQLMEYLTADMAGAVVVLDPDTGFVQALASYPTFDPNDFTLGISETLWKYYNDPKSNLPLFDRATRGLYPPGSTLKPFTASIALMAGAVDSDYVFQGTIEDNLWTPDIPGWVYPPIKRYSSTPNPLHMRNAMIHSDNIFFADIAMRTGAAEFYGFCQQLGMDRAIPSDVPVSRPGITNSGEFETIKVLADSGYGQGEILITPLQMTSLFASLTNGGTIYSPAMVRSVCRTVGREYETVRETQPTPWISGAITGDVLEKVEPLLRLVVSEGTAQSIDVDGLDVHGKTGTAQIGDDRTREIAWIIGYTGSVCESTGTRRLVCVTLEVPAGEGDFRGKIVKALLMQ